MSRIYTNTNKIKFTDISEKYRVQKAVKAKVSQLHSALITYVVSHYKDTKRYKQSVVDVLNILTYSIYAEEALPLNWSANSPFENVPDIDADLVEEALGDIYLTVEGIQWDVKPTDVSDGDMNISYQPSLSHSKPTNTKQQPVKSNSNSSKKSSPSQSNNNNVSTNIKEDYSVVINPTPKQDLYIQPPVIPQFDYSRPWMKGVDGADMLVIYTTLPEIPTKQNEISVTTDVTKMTSKELVKLYPNHIIHTRSSVMYEPCEGIELDPQLGLILPIEGFTREQVIDNIIRYPHIFKLSRKIDDSFVSLYSHIEIDGELKPTLEIWNDLPESKVIPRQSEFVKEYVVRRYLLERDVKKVKHKYPIFGTLEPFLTLFMSPTDYINIGYTNIEEIVKQCVISRVSYKQSRNPVIRRLSNNAELHI